MQVLRMPLFQLPQLITQLVNARVALTRLQEFLAAPQQPPARALPPAEPGADSSQPYWLPCRNLRVYECIVKTPAGLGSVMAADKILGPFLRSPSPSVLLDQGVTVAAIGTQ